MEESKLPKIFAIIAVCGLVLSLATQSARLYRTQEKLDIAIKEHDSLLWACWQNGFVKGHLQEVDNLTHADIKHNIVIPEECNK